MKLEGRGNKRWVKDSNTIAGAKKDSYTITKIYIP
jgi:hypothetical protein